MDLPGAEIDDAKSGNADGASIDTERPATPRPRKPFPEHLPHETFIHPVCACPECGNRRLHKVGEDRRKVLERIPATLKVIEHVRPECATVTASRRARRRLRPCHRACNGGTCAARPYPATGRSEHPRSVFGYPGLKGRVAPESHDRYIPEDLPTLLFGRKAANSELVFN